jgi:hypothetical protein
VRTGLKKARRQNPVLTYRNGIRGFLKRVSKHIITNPVVNNLQEVDTAAIGGRNMQLPGEISIAFDKRRRSQQKP